MKFKNRRSWTKTSELQLRLEVPRDHPRLYWAYGSNLNVLQMQQRCPECFPAAPMNYPDMRLLFSSVATVEYEKGSTCPGALWRVSLGDIAALDIYEGWPHLYQKVYFDVNWSNGQTEKAFYYVMGDAEEWSPTIGYVECVLEGYGEWGLDEDALFAAWQRAEDADELFFEEALPSNYIEWRGEDEWVYNDLTGAWRQLDTRKAREGWEVADSSNRWEDKPFRGYHETSYDWQKWIDEGLVTADELDYDPTMKSV